MCVCVCTKVLYEAMSSQIKRTHRLHIYIINNNRNTPFNGGVVSSGPSSSPLLSPLPSVIDSIEGHTISAEALVWRARSPLRPVCVFSVHVRECEYESNLAYVLSVCTYLAWLCRLAAVDYHPDL